MGKLSKEELEEELELQAFERENFENWVKSWKIGTFDLSKSNQEILWEIYSRFASAEIQTGDKFSKMIFLSYYLRDRNSVAQYENHADLRLKNVPQLYAKFLTDLTGEKYDKLNFEQAMEAYGKHMTTMLLDIFGRAVALDFKDTNGRCFIKNAIVKELLAKGFENPAKDFILYVNPNYQPQHAGKKEEHQKYIKDLYLKILNHYAQKSPASIRDNTLPEEFEKIWGSIRFFTQEMRSRMTDKTLGLAEVEKSKEVESRLFDDFCAKRKRKLVVVKQGDYYKTVNAAIQKLNDGTASEEDKETFKEFLDRCVLLKQALSIVDGKGNPYGAHYFVFMPMETCNFSILLKRAEMCGVTDRETRKMLIEVKRVLSQAFTNTVARPTSGIVEIEPVLKEFRKLKTSANGMEIDLTDDKVFKEFEKTAERILKEYNLPKTKECIETIARDLSKGRNPINLGELDPIKAETKTSATKTSAGKVK